MKTLTSTRTSRLRSAQAAQQNEAAELVGAGLAPRARRDFIGFRATRTINP